MFRQRIPSEEERADAGSDAVLDANPDVHADTGIEPTEAEQYRGAERAVALSS